MKDTQDAQELHIQDLDGCCTLYWHVLKGSCGSWISTTFCSWILWSMGLPNRLFCGFCSGADPEKLQGEGHESQWSLPIPKIQKLNGFRPLYFGGCPIFSSFIFFHFFFSKARGAPGRPVVPLTGVPARPVVLLGGLWWP